MRYVNRWSMSSVWVVAMAVAWFVVLPGVMSPSTFVFAMLTGPILFVGGAMFWETTRPTPSFRQSQATADPRGAAETEKRQ